MASLTEILIMRGIVPINQLDNVSNVRTEDDAFILELLERGDINQAQVASAIAAQAGLPFVELLDFPVDRGAVARVPASICRRHEVLPIEIVGETLIVAVADPGDVFALDDVRAVSRMQARAVVAERSDLRAAIDRY
ncbi:MAG: type II secretion system protein GspE, partial [Salinibacterium sp.]|nr:type II secretion system protein GspE [Salinibacterium sp.]